MIHPITPPTELFAEWFANSLKKLDRTVSRDDRGTTGLIAGEVAIQAARWGSDQELEACCEYMQHEDFHGFAKELRAARRPKPPNLKKQALIELGDVYNRDKIEDFTYDTIRKALEQLDD